MIVEGVVHSGGEYGTENFIYEAIPITILWTTIDKNKMLEKGDCLGKFVKEDALKESTAEDNGCCYHIFWIKTGDSHWHETGTSFILLSPSYLWATSFTESLLDEKIGPVSKDP